jgi:coenzyme PQQ precursor peptide PqqA
MIVPYGPAPYARIMAATRARLTTHRRHTMKWETPEAIDMRFGMEITMYISNR